MCPGHVYNVQIHKKMYTDLTFVVVCSYIHAYTVESQKMATCKFFVTGRSITHNAL